MMAAFPVIPVPLALHAPSVVLWISHGETPPAKPSQGRSIVNGSRAPLAAHGITPPPVERDQKTSTEIGGRPRARPIAGIGPSEAVPRLAIHPAPRGKGFDIHDLLRCGWPGMPEARDIQ